MSTLRNYINIIKEAQAEANPYVTPEDRAKFAAMSPEDKEWYTRGGQVPDINDQYIAARAPNRGRAVAQAPASNPTDNRLAAGTQTTPAEPPAAVATPVVPGIATGVNDQGQNVTMPNGINPETGAPTVTTTGAAPVRPAGQGANPVATPANPLTVHIQQTLKRLGADLGTTGPNKDGVDGTKGPKTIAMMKKYGIGDDGKPIANPAAPATGTQSNAVVNAAAAGAKPQSVETGAGAFTGNPVVQGAQARMSPALATKPIDPATGKPTDWGTMSLAQRAQWNNLQRANTAAAPAVKSESLEPTYNELARIVSLVHHR